MGTGRAVEADAKELLPCTRGVSTGRAYSHTRQRTPARAAVTLPSGPGERKRGRLLYSRAGAATGAVSLRDARPPPGLEVSKGRRLHGLPRLLPKDRARVGRPGDLSGRQVGRPRREGGREGGADTKQVSPTPPRPAAVTGVRRTHRVYKQAPGIGQEVFAKRGGGGLTGEGVP